MVLRRDSFYALPEFLKVDVTETRNNREYFKIMEGSHKGQRASVSMRLVKGPCFLFGVWCKDDTYISHFSATNPQRGAVLVRYQKVTAVDDGVIGATERSKVSVGYLHGSRFNVSHADIAVVHQLDLMQPGRYKLLIPDYEHVLLGQRYVTHSPYATTWFPIQAPLLIDDPQTRKDERGTLARYFHMGTVSLGCVSARPSRSWTEIARLVGSSRLDPDSVGHLEVLPVAP